MSGMSFGAVRQHLNARGITVYRGQPDRFGNDVIVATQRQSDGSMTRMEDSDPEGLYVRVLRAMA